MWILPKQLHTSDFVPDTAALSWDSTELSEICARSLFVRSKPSPARTWSQKWKRDSWTQHLSGRILNPSHGQSFVAAWTSSLGAIPASHSAQPESDSAPKTLATSGHLSQTEFGFCDPSSASLIMSKDTSALASEKSLESWNQSVTKRRGEYSARLKLAHRTSASGFSSWPSPIASEVRQGFQDRSRGMKGSQESLTTVVVKEQSEYPTPRTTDWKSTPNAPSNPIRVGEGTATLGEFIHAHGQANWPTPDASNHRDGDVLRKDNNLEQGGFHGVSLHHAMTKYGHPAPANPNTHGSRQGLWATPRSGKTTDENPETWALRQAKGDVATMPLTAQVKCWGTPTARDHKSGRGNEDREYKELTPMVERTQSGKLNPRWVETLMGLPVGWVMPSCKSPVTIEPTNYDSSATESCLQQPSELLEF
jgi:hypothetical protein